MPTKCQNMSKIIKWYHSQIGYCSVEGLDIYLVELLRRLY